MYGETEEYKELCYYDRNQRIVDATVRKHRLEMEQKKFKMFSQIKWELIRQYK